MKFTNEHIRVLRKVNADQDRIANFAFIPTKDRSLVTDLIDKGLLEQTRHNCVGVTLIGRLVCVASYDEVNWQVRDEILEICFGINSDLDDEDFPQDLFEDKRITTTH